MAGFIGYRAKAGTAGAILDHTYTDRIADVRLNESSVGELGLNAALAGAFGVPVAVVSGDRAPAAEAQALPVDGTRAVVVKEAVSRHAARSVAPERARAMIRDAVREAVARSDPPRRPYTVTPPITVEIDFVITAHADHAAMAPAFRRSGPRTVSFRSDDYREPFRAFRTMFNLGGLE